MDDGIWLVFSRRSARSARSQYLNPGYQPPAWHVALQIRSVEHGQLSRRWNGGRTILRTMTLRCLYCQDHR